MRQPFDGLRVTSGTSTGGAIGGFAVDDVERLTARDREGMIAAVASGADQVREAAAATGAVDALRAAARPRSLVVCGMGGSGIAGDLLASVAGGSCPVPITTHRGYGLPGWAGSQDLVAVVSCSGRTEETLSALAEARRRGCPVVGVGAEGSPLQAGVQDGGGTFLTVPQGRQPRASVWSLVVPLLLAADALGLVHLPAEHLRAAGVVLDGLAQGCAPGRPIAVNPAKTLATGLAGTLPVLWGTSPATGVVAYRAACQFNENAKHPAVWGVLPEANHNQVVALDGPHGALGPSAHAAGGRTPLHLVLLRDGEEDPRVSRRAEISAEIAEERGVPVTVVRASGTNALERMASLVGLFDWTTVYLALGHDLDPSPVTAIDAVKRRLAS